MNIQQIQGLVELLREASDVLGSTELVVSECELPSNWRYPLKDELYGYALMLEDVLDKEHK